MSDGNVAEKRVAKPTLGAARLKRRRQSRPEAPDDDDGPSLGRSTVEWVGKAVAHARGILDTQAGRPLEPFTLFQSGRSSSSGAGARGAPSASGNALEAVALFTAVLGRVPSLWAELAQDVLIAMCALRGSSTGAGTRRLLAEGLADMLPPARELGQEKALASAAVILLCFLGEAHADEGHYMAAFKVLHRAASVAQRTGNKSGEDQARAAMEGLRTAALQRWHFQMINDVERGAQYECAIAGAVSRLSRLPRIQARKGIIALDIGTGTGLLALMCARMKGVKSVHACEMNDALCAVAQEVVVQHKRSCPGSSDVHMHSTVSTKLELEEKVDLIFCEIFDAGLLGEHALPTLFHAHASLLQEGGLIIPARATVFGKLVESTELLSRFGIIHRPPGVSFDGLNVVSKERYTCETISALDHFALSEPVQLLKFDFTDALALHDMIGKWLEPPIDIAVTHEGTVHALVFWWNVELDTAGECQISSAPSAACDSWQQAVCPLVPVLPDAPGLRAQVGETFTLHAKVQIDGIQWALAEAVEARHAHGFGKTREEDKVVKLTDEELWRVNDIAHWAAVKQCIKKVLSDMQASSGIQVIDISESPLRVAAFLASSCCREQGIKFAGLVLGASGEEERTAIETLVHSNVPEDWREQVSILIATPLQVIQASLPAPFPPRDPRDAEHERPHGSMPDALVLCDDVVDTSGNLRTGVLDDLMMLWTRSGPVAAPARRIHVVPSSLTVHLTLIQSSELLRRHCVTETPGGIDVSCINALSVPQFMGLEEALLKPQPLSEAVPVLQLPLGSPELLVVLQRLAGEDGVPGLGSSGNCARMRRGDGDTPSTEPFLVKLVASEAGCLHGLVIDLQFPQTDAQEEPAGSSSHPCNVSSKKLAGICWPMDAKSGSPRLHVGDAAVLEVRYSSSRGLTFNPISIVRCQACGDKAAKLAETKA